MANKNKPRKRTRADKTRMNKARSEDKRAKNAWQRAREVILQSKKLPKNSREEQIHQDFNVGLKTRKYTDSYNCAVAVISSPIYAYGTGFKIYYPESYVAHLQAISDFTEKYKIPYDPDMQRYYLGSFAGVFTATVGLKYGLQVMDEYLWSRKNKDINFKTLEGISQYTEDQNQINNNTTRSAVIIGALYLTAYEAITAHLPNRTFDWGDMTCYAAALAVYVGGLSVVNKKAEQSVTSTSPTVT